MTGVALNETFTSLPCVIANDSLSQKGRKTRRSVETFERFFKADASFSVAYCALPAW